MGQPSRSAAVVILLTALSGCGAGGVRTDAAAGYPMAGNAGCRTAAAATRRLPELQRAAHMTVHELVLEAQHIGARFRATMSVLRPPAALAAAHRQRLADLRQTVPATARTYLSGVRRLAADYRAVRLNDCLAGARAAIAQYQRHPAPIAH